MSEMKTAGKNQRSIMDNIVIVSAIIGQARMEKKKHIYILCSCSKVFGKLWFQDCITELAKLGYNKNDTEILYKLNETAQVKINTPYGDTEKIDIKKVVKHSLLHLMCAIAHAHIRTLATSLMSIKDSMHHFCL